LHQRPNCFAFSEDVTNAKCVAAFFGAGMEDW
jgi:hypothetical protein